MWCLFDMCTEITEGFRFNGAHLQVTLSEGRAWRPWIYYKVQVNRHTGIDRANTNEKIQIKIWKQADSDKEWEKSELIAKFSVLTFESVLWGSQQGEHIWGSD